MYDLKRVLILVALLLLSSVPLAACQPYCDETGAGEFGIAPPAGNPLRVLVAYDEEIAGNTYDWFDSEVDGRTFVRWQTIRALYRFPKMFHFRIIDYVEWDSADGSTLEESLLELEDDFGWDKGMWWYGRWVGLLIGWTGENNEFAAGKAHMGNCACLIKHQTDWTDDNTVQEEVTHLFGVDTHCQDDGCVMSRKQKFYGYINENLRPIEERTVNWIPIFNNQPVGAVSHGWCSTHYSKLLESEGLPDRSGGGIMSDPGINPVNPPPEGKEGINPTNPWVPWAILGMFLAIVAIVVVYIYMRTRKVKP